MAVEHNESFVAEAVNSFLRSAAAVVVAGDDDGVGNAFEADVGPALDLGREEQGMSMVAVVDIWMGWCCMTSVVASHIGAVVCGSVVGDE